MALGTAKKRVMEAVVERSSGWRPGEGMLLDGFVVGVEGWLEE